MPSSKAAAQAPATKTVIAALFEANVGRVATQTTPEGEKRFRVTRLSDQLGNLPDKSKAEYVIFTDLENVSKVVKMNPTDVQKLFKDGKLKAWALTDEIAPEPTAEAPAADAGDKKEAAKGNEGTTENTATDDAGKGAEANAGAAAEPTETKEAKKAREKAEKEEKKKERETKRAADKEAKEQARLQEIADRKAEKDKTSKKPKAIEIFLSQAGGDKVLAGEKLEGHRKAVIEIFRKKDGLNMSGPGANTYYQNIKNGPWSDAAKAALAAKTKPADAEQQTS